MLDTALVALIGIIAVVYLVSLAYSAIRGLAQSAKGGSCIHCGCGEKIVDPNIK